MNTAIAKALKRIAPDLDNAARHIHNLELYVGDDGQIYHGRVRERNRGRWAK